MVRPMFEAVFAACHAAAPEAAVLCAAEPLPDGAAAASMIHLLPAGEIRTVDGRGPYTYGLPAGELARRSLLAAGGRLPIDENHSTDLAAPKGLSAPARGWIVGLHAREDGIWGEVEWTEEGKRLVEGRSYRNISPVITHSADNRVTGILRASLVNRPNLRGLAALHQEQSMLELIEKLRAALGLADDAGEDVALQAVSDLKASVSAHAVELHAIGAAAGLEGEPDQAAVLHAVQDLVDPTKFVPVEAVVALQQELAGRAGEITALQADTAKAKAEAFVDHAIAAGKVGVKALRSHFIARHMREAENVEREIGALPSLTGRSGATAQPPENAGKPGAAPGGLSEEGKRIVQLMGIDPEAYKATQVAIAVVEEAL